MTGIIVWNSKTDMNNGHKTVGFIPGFKSKEVCQVIFYVLNLQHLRFISRSDKGVGHQLFSPDQVLVKIDQRPESDQEHGNDPDGQENQEVPFALFNHSQ